jgi:hypothetical protein
MKKIVLVLAVLLLASPALADVVITVEATSDSNVCTITYDASTETELPRAFALNVTVSGANIVEVNNYHVGESNAAGQGYGIFMGTIVIDNDGNVTDAGTPVAPNNHPGALGGIGTSGVTLEMGSLYEDSNYAPDPCGTLCCVEVSQGCADLSVTVEDTYRGGIVMEDGNNPGTVDLSGATDVSVGPCDKCYTGPEPTEWGAVGEPDCWCASVNPRQCHGDADGTGEGKLGDVWVATYDLAVFLEAWNKTEAQLGLPSDPCTINVGGQDVKLICADFTHTGEGKLGDIRVATLDLGIFLANWNIAGKPDPNCP